MRSSAASPSRRVWSPPLPEQRSAPLPQSLHVPDDPARAPDGCERKDDPHRPLVIAALARLMAKAAGARESQEAPHDCDRHRAPAPNTVRGLCRPPPVRSRFR